MLDNQGTNKLSIGKNAATRHKKFEMGLGFMVLALFAFVFVVFILFFLSTISEKSSPPLVVLYHGHPKGAEYEWNTGVWPAWGERK